MNKSLTIGAIGIILIIVFSIYIQSYLKKSSDKLLYFVSEVGLENGFNDNWEKTKKYWAILIDHTEIDNIEELIKRIEALTNSADEKTELLAELNKLKFYIAHIPEKEEFSIKNIL